MGEMLQHEVLGSIWGKGAEVWAGRGAFWENTQLWGAWWAVEWK